jgi:hypothetical protein
MTLSKRGNKLGRHTGEIHQYARDAGVRRIWHSRAHKVHQAGLFLAGIGAALFWLHSPALVIFGIVLVIGLFIFVR